MYIKLHQAIIEKVKFIKNTEIFSGFVSIRLLSTNDRIEWAKWTNPLIGDGYGVVTTPVEDDVVIVGFDFRNRCFIVGMLTYAQMSKPILEDQVPYEGEENDPRLKVKQGELLLRGKNKSSIHFKNDGSTVFKLNDEKEDSDINNVVIKIDANRNITILNANDISVDCKNASVVCEEKSQVTAQEAFVEADKVEVKSNDIQLGKDGDLAPSIRDVDRTEHIDPVVGIPVQSIRYLTRSGTTKVK